MIRKLGSLANLGVQPTFSAPLVKRIRITNFLAFGTMAICSLESLYYLSKGGIYVYSGFSALLITCILIFVLILNNMGQHIWSRTILGPSFALLLISSLCVEGTRHGLHYYAPLFLMCAYVFFDRSEVFHKRIYLLLTAICSLVIIYMAAIDFTGFIDPFKDEDPTNRVIARSLNFVITVIQAAYITFTLWKENALAEAGLADKNAEIQSIMDNISIGVFSISKIDEQSGKIPIDDLVSSQLGQIIGFESSRLPKDIDSLLFKRSTMDSDEVALAHSVIIMALGSNILSFETNAGSLPNEIMIDGQGRVRILKLSWNTVLGPDHSTVIKILVSVENVTELMEYKKRNEEQQLNMLKIGELIAVEPRKFIKFHFSSKRTIHETFNHLTRLKNNNLNDITKENLLKAIFIHIHTIKGNSRSLNLKSLTSMVHEAEDVLIKMRANGFFDCNVAIGYLQKIESILDHYNALSRDKLNRTDDGGENIIVKRPYATLLVDQLVAEDTSANIAPLLNAVYTSLESIFEECDKTLPRLAKDLGKDKPEVTLDGVRGVYFNPNDGEVLYNALGHLYRNAMDHGLETSKARKLKGKKPEGLISVRGEFIDGAFIIRFSDDGDGLALEKITAKAKSCGLLTEDVHLTNQETAELIFAEGLSTAHEVSEISGRGVGMGAVRSLLQEIGADLTVEICERQLPCVPFVLKISIPRQIIQNYPKANITNQVPLLSAS